MANKKVFVTGAAGFIGAFLVKKLLEETDYVIVGLDNLNSYYDPGIKDARLRMLAEADPESRFTFVRGDLCDAALIERLFAENCFDVVVNLAAQAGVRYSIENPRAYLESNLVGFFNVLEACRHHPVKHLVYASSSSVYGGNKKVPFSEEDRVDSPVSLYAATKKSNELMAAAYSKLYSIPATGLRFFTVYGPMGRPDMAYFGFTEKLRRAVTALKSAGVQPVLMTLPPIDGQRYFRFISQKTDGGSVLRWLGDVGRIYRHQELYSDAVAALAFAEGVPLIDVRRQFLPQRDLSGLIAADGIHLTMSGYRCLFDTLADWVRARL